MKKLFFRLVFLMALIGALVVLPANFSGSKVSAEPDCPWCDQARAACVAACPGQGEPGHFACIGDCNMDWRSCVVDCFSSTQ